MCKSGRPHMRHLALRHDVDFGFLDQGNPQYGSDISDVQVD